MANLFDKAKAAVKRLMWSPTQTDDAQLTASGRVIPDHPADKIDPSKLKSLQEDAEQGDITAQHELFVDIEERDGDIGANIGTRKRAVLTLDWSINAPDNATAQEEQYAEEVRTLFKRIGYIDDLLMDCMDAVGHGFAALEIMWQLVDNKQLPLKFKHIPQSWFRLDKDDNLLLKTPTNPLGEPLRPFGWVVHIHKSRSVPLARMGLYRTLAWHYMFKHYSVHDFAEFLELYGMPIRIGKYGAGASNDDKKTLLRALAGIGHNAAGIMPENMQIELHNAANSTSGDPFMHMVNWCEKSIARLILGQTLTSGVDGKTATNALGKVHNEVRHDLLVSDAKQLAQTITQQIILPFLQINVDPNIDAGRIPYFDFDVREYEDFAVFSEALPKLVAIGVRVPEKWARDKVGIPEPEDGELILTAIQNPLNADLKTQSNPTALALSGYAHGVGCPCGCQSVALKSDGQNGNEQQILDKVLDKALLQVDFNAQLHPTLRQAVAVLQSSASYAEASDKLAALYPTLDNNAHQTYLANALFLSELLGGSSVRD